MIHTKQIISLLLCFLPIFSFGQNNKLLETQNGYRDFKFGMTSEEVNAFGVFKVPYKSQQFVATEYQNSDVTYVAYDNLDQYQILKDNGYAYYLGKPIRYICLLFYKNKLFKIRIHFFDKYPDNNASILESTNQYYGVKTTQRTGNKYGQLFSDNVKYEGISEGNGTITSIMFEKINVENLIAANLPFDETNLAKFKRPKMYAVIIGIDDYSQTDANTLKYCVKDADMIYNFLKSPQGGNVPENQIALLKDKQATKLNILNNVNSIFAQAQSNDVVMFFFSGHGGPNCFLTYDQLLFHKDLKNIIYYCKAKIKFCIADACHSGSWDKKYSVSTKDMTPEQITQLYYQSIASSGGGTALFMASQSDETSLVDPELEQSLFTFYILEGLKGSADTDFDHIITIGELYEYAKLKTVERAANRWRHSQHPQIKGTFDFQTPIGIRK